MTDISPSLQCEMYRSANSVRYLALRSASEFPFSTRITPRRLTLTDTECNCQLHFHRPACHLQSSFGRLIGIPFVQTKPNPRGWVNDPENHIFPGASTMLVGPHWFLRMVVRPCWDRTLTGFTQPRILPCHRHILVVSAIPDVGAVAVAELKGLVLGNGHGDRGANAGVPLDGEPVFHTI